MRKKRSKKIVILKIALICVFSFSACMEIEENGDDIQQTEQIFRNSSSTEMADEMKSDNTDTESETIESEPLSKEQQWKVFICPDMPQPYIEVLQQYEQFMNADNRSINDESVQRKFWSGEWKNLYDELCASWSAFVYMEMEEAENAYHYALADLTGDGFPEMIIAYKDTPEVIYNYSETKGIEMECMSSYYQMTIYENNIVEYVSAGAYSSTTYLQFQNDVEDWVIQDIVACEGTWDSDSQKWIDEKFYAGEWDESGRLADTISEEEYLRIQEKYVTKPMQFEWFPLIEKKSSVNTPD